MHTRMCPWCRGAWLACVLVVATVVAAHAAGSATPSLQSYTGLLNMPTARVLPDWTMRLHYGNADPYQYYGGALGVWDRLEVHGQFTEVDTIIAFPDNAYGNYKDRSAGARVVLVPEDDGWPQIAAGFFDATGTALFGQRYLVASKSLGDFDLTFGLGQGALAGEYVPDTVTPDGGNEDRAFSFLTSSPLRETKPFGGLAWQMTPNLRAALEYSSLDRATMFGYRDRAGKSVKSSDSRWPVNLGLQYRLGDNFTATAAWMRGDTFALGTSLEFPLDPHGMLGWQQEAPPQAHERQRWQAHSADNAELADLVGNALDRDGFAGVAVACSDTAIWLEAANTRYLSNERALSRMAAVADAVLPHRIRTLYCNILVDGQVLTSLATNREHLRDFLASRQDAEGFLQFADLQLYGSRHWADFQSLPGAMAKTRQPMDSWDFQLEPKVRTFLNNRSGFFKHKAVLRASAEYHPWRSGTLFGSYEWTLFNQYDDLVYNPLEEDAAVRTDLVSYEERSAPRVTELGLDQYWTAPWDIQTRFAAGIFESAFAGFGAETFRYFRDGMFGLGLEAATVRKRSTEKDFALDDASDQWFTNVFCNLYAQLWPEQGLEGGLKIGRFLAGDPGVRLDLRRTFKHFTIGGWMTWTDTGVFDSPKNQDAQQKGVYVRVPFSIFSNTERRGHFQYGISSFTRDQGAIADQPSSLYPMDPTATPRHTRDNITDMRHHGARP